RRRHTRSYGDWSSDVCSSDLRFSLLCEAKHAQLRLTANTGNGGFEFVRGHRKKMIFERVGLLKLLVGLLKLLVDPLKLTGVGFRSEERRVGKECRLLWETAH